jgi:hypothetical protein
MQTKANPGSETQPKFSNADTEGDLDQGEYSLREPDSKPIECSEKSTPS